MSESSKEIGGKRILKIMQLEAKLKKCQDIAIALAIEHNEKVAENDKLKACVKFYANYEI